MGPRLFHFYNNYVRRLFDTDLHLFELSVWIQTFAQSLISVFIPIILWRLGLSIRQIITFYLIFNVFDVPLNLLARHLIVKYGARIVTILSIIANVLYLTILFNLHNSWTQIVVLALMLAIYDSFYWVANVYIFVQSAHGSEKIRNDVGALNIIRSIGGLLAPAIGALILLATDQRTLIFVSTILMFASLIPLFRMRHLKFKPEKAPSSFKEFFAQPIERFNYFFQCLSALHSEAENVIWPFFVFFLFGNIRPVAIIAVVISFAGLIVTYITGKYSVRKNIYQLVAAGGLILAFLWTLRLVNPANSWILYVTVFLIALTTILVDIPLDVAAFERGRMTDILNAATYMNLFRMATRGVLYFFLLFAPLLIFRNSLYAVIIGMIVLFGMGMLVSLRVDRLFSLKAGPVDVEK